MVNRLYHPFALTLFGLYSGLVGWAYGCFLGGVHGYHMRGVHVGVCGVREGSYARSTTSSAYLYMRASPKGLGSTRGVHVEVEK